jgi:hypothetical protein
MQWFKPKHFVSSHLQDTVISLPLLDPQAVSAAGPLTFWPLALKLLHVV